MKPKRRFPLPIHFSTLPAVATLSIVFLSGLTLLDLARKKHREEIEMEANRLPLPKPLPSEKRVPVTEGVPLLTVDQALAVLKDRPTRAAVAFLWPKEEYREKLLEVLIAGNSPEEVRLFLLGAFELTEPGKAITAARAIASENDRSEGPLLISAFEILARHGEATDSSLFSERPGESHQLRTLREGYRNDFLARFQGTTKA